MWVERAALVLPARVVHRVPMGQLAGMAAPAAMVATVAGSWVLAVRVAAVAPVGQVARVEMDPPVRMARRRVLRGARAVTVAWVLPAVWVVRVATLVPRGSCCCSPATGPTVGAGPEEAGVVPATPATAAKEATETPAPRTAAWVATEVTAALPELAGAAGRPGPGEPAAVLGPAVLWGAAALTVTAGRVAMAGTAQIHMFRAGTVARAATRARWATAEPVVEAAQAPQAPTVLTAKARDPPAPVVPPAVRVDVVARAAWAELFPATAVPEVWVAPAAPVVTVVTASTGSTALRPGVPGPTAGPAVTAAMVVPEALVALVARCWARARPGPTEMVVQAGPAATPDRQVTAVTARTARSRSRPVAPEAWAAIEATLESAAQVVRPVTVVQADRPGYPEPTARPRRAAMAVMVGMAGTCRHLPPVEPPGPRQRAPVGLSPQMRTWKPVPAAPAVMPGQAARAVWVAMAAMAERPVTAVEVGLAVPEASAVAPAVWVAKVVPEVQERVTAAPVARAVRAVRPRQTRRPAQVVWAGQAVTRVQLAAAAQGVAVVSGAPVGSARMAAPESRELRAAPAVWAALAGQVAWAGPSAEMVVREVLEVPVAPVGTAVTGVMVRIPLILQLTVAPAVTAGRVHRAVQVATVGLLARLLDRAATAPAVPAVSAVQAALRATRAMAAGVLTARS